MSLTASAAPSFDVTPAELVTGLITERGLVLQPDATKLRRLFAKTNWPRMNTDNAKHHSVAHRGLSVNIRD